MFEFLKDKIHEADVFEYGFVNPADLEYRQTIRDICELNTCKCYGTTWACPPAVGTVEECRERCLQYDSMMAFSGLCLLEDSFDFEGMKKGMSDFKDVAHRLGEILRPHLGRFQVLSNESCNQCSKCTYPDAPCRFPETLHHSIEGYGILVSDLAQRADVTYNNGPNTVTYFGAVLFNKSEVHY